MHDDDTDQLIQRAGKGDPSAAHQLLERHRGRLRQMVEVRMDPQLAARLDPSDVVQETLLYAFRKLPSYLVSRPVGFYPWLRQIAWERLVDLHRAHLRRRKRSARLEQPRELGMPERSAIRLAERVLSSGTSPSGQLLREELRQRVRLALEQLAGRDRDLLVMRFLEQLSTSEISESLGIPEGTVKSRIFRALQKLQAVLDDDTTEKHR